jgi:hypothetical protein
MKCIETDLYKWRVILCVAQGSDSRVRLVRAVAGTARAACGAGSCALVAGERREHRKLLDQHGLICSMSRRGNCWDSAVAESFFATLQKELAHHEQCAKHEQALRSIFDYIELDYNRWRSHSNINYQRPLKLPNQVSSVTLPIPAKSGEVQILLAHASHFRASEANIRQQNDLNMQRHRATFSHRRKHERMK